jgi:hypothetical protein
MERWAALAAGRYDAATLAWLSEVARDVLKANAEPDENKRRTGMVRAVKLDGRMNTAREALRIMLSALGITDWSTAPDKARTRDALAAVLGEADISDEALDKRIREALQK